MAIYDIIQFPDDRLSIVAEPVKEVNQEIQQIVKNMFNTLYNAKNCAALAASQLDIPWSDGVVRRITVIDFSPKKDQPLCLINPEISDLQGETKLKEGCMSVAVVSAAVKRYKKIRVQALNSSGSKIDFIAEDFMAKCIQHELDHLDGKLFLDRLSALRKAMLVKRVLKKQVH